MSTAVYTMAVASGLIAAAVSRLHLIDKSLVVAYLMRSIIHVEPHRFDGRIARQRAGAVLLLRLNVGFMGRLVAPQRLFAHLRQSAVGIRDQLVGIVPFI